jgi:hypothetical protein
MGTKSPGRNTATQTPQTPVPVYLYPSPPRGGEGVCGAITTPPPHFPAAREERIFERPQRWTPTAKVPPALASIVAAPLVHCTACRSHTKRQAPTAAAEPRPSRSRCPLHRPSTAAVAQPDGLRPRRISTTNRHPKAHADNYPGTTSHSPTALLAATATPTTTSTARPNPRPRLHRPQHQHRTADGDYHPTAVSSAATSTTAPTAEVPPAHGTASPQPRTRTRPRFLADTAPLAHCTAAKAPTASA